jgi:hypothetical protein
MKPAKYLGPQCNELPSTESEKHAKRFAGLKKLGSQPFRDSELEFTSSSRAAAFVSRQLTVGSPFSENDTLYVTLAMIISENDVLCVRFDAICVRFRMLINAAFHLTSDDDTMQKPMDGTKRLMKTMPS